ncbi:MAG: FAD-binding oxidoreductase [Dysgonamonadaceae bacterium]|jgi:D-lactate dehydrogenase|nr:FAD-binding oxidoreductase [Dysgonamonadaceae bacterium]
MNPKITTLLSELHAIHPEITTFTDPLMTLAKGTDAGFYRLIPEVVIRVNKEEEVISVLRLCRKHQLPLTFKAGGTSLSGQTVSDSVLVELGPGFRTSLIADDGAVATFGPAVIGDHANRQLSRFGRKLGPSPASIDSAKIGGIVANNASGSSYGIIHNSYHTIKSMRIVLMDGTILDTGNDESRRQFEADHAGFCTQLLNLRNQMVSHPELSEKIQKKFGLKNTCGYGMNALLDFDNPIDIIQHLMVGSEGTLGFISQVTFNTVPDYRLKATALIYFPHIRHACEAILPLRACKGVSAAELMDRNALRAVEDLPGMPSELKLLDDNTVALLIDTSADEDTVLSQQIEEIIRKLEAIPTVFPVQFTRDSQTYDTYWKVRKGLFTTAAATRPKGTACIIEDLAFRADVLGDALVALQELFARYQYHRAIIWGHLLDGNIHFVIMPDFNSVGGIEEYRHFMIDLVTLAIDRFDGSLKAEHGTGRNMAPFVEKEWGSEIYDLMKSVKALFDPEQILNPGVILNEDKDIFVKHLKPIPVVHELIDKCIECGFCESECPARNLTLTPRQRIVLYRQLSVLQNENKDSGQYFKMLQKEYRYNGNETCATDGLCERSCPVGINTGKLIKELRLNSHKRFVNAVATYLADHLSLVSVVLRWALKIPHAFAKLTGYPFIETSMRFVYRLSGRKFPLWTRYTPTGSPRINCSAEDKQDRSIPEVVYFPSCINRTMGISPDYPEKTALVSKMQQLLAKGGYRILYPKQTHKLCCGMAFDSKGFKKQGLQKAKELEKALLEASDSGRIPILCDMSPCLLRMKETLDPRLRLYEPVAFILEFLQDKLHFRKLPIKVAIHSTCSNTKMGLNKQLYQLASLCAEEVVVPVEVGCCAWAGDRGFFYPELNQSALADLPGALKDVERGYSTSRTCEIGLTIHSGITYQSIIYLVDEATTP